MGGPSTTLDELLTLFCPGCGADRPAEMPPCPDGHGSDCPDRACVECGAALSVDVVLVALAFPAGAGRRAA